MAKFLLQVGLLALFAIAVFAFPRSYSDQSISVYLTERICWSGEVCKEEFQSQFRCKCPSWSFCRSPGKYYNAVCSMTNTGYIWTQPDKDWRTVPKMI